MSETFIAAFVLGLMGAGHCLGMCGGLAAALAFANQGKSKFHRFAILLSYNIGRIFSYGLIGWIFGFIFSNVDQLSPVPVLRAVSGVLLIAMGFYLADWWKVLTRLERLGSLLWRWISPLGRRLMPVTNTVTALFLGLLWGWLPCGLVYSVLALAAAQGEALAGAGVMVAFGLGTVPAVLAGGLASNYIKTAISNVWVRRLFGIGFIVYGIVTLLPVIKLLLVASGVLAASEQGMMHHHH
ncbi:sulfite exporter TauE/SafE family protein [Teredinibacter haidensis]|uniref:sulfite exporter TauE/SafE family protein n=1 Tax=Teredinibacter haidensis TaxID=2731755 RepID=UPI000948FFBF|nr:sulfite exporter TauE/SafE family protein [Teredinibacter haidensis]